MAVSVTCTAVLVEPGRRIVRFGKTGVEVTSLQAARDYVRAILTPDVLQAILIAKSLEADPTGAALPQLVGRTATADLTLASNVVRVT